MSSIDKERLSTVNLQLNIDGIPLHKSTKQQFWPILGRILDSGHSSPFIIGLFCGDEKPSSVSEYLSDFIEDIKGVQLEGLLIEGHKMDVNIILTICVGNL